MAQGPIKALCTQGTFTPSSNSTKSLTGQCQWYRIGNWVYLSCAIWTSGSDSSSDAFHLNIPFNIANQRAYGVVGYSALSASKPNLHMVGVGATKYLAMEYGGGGAVTQVTRNEISTFQFSIVYITDG